MTNTVTLTLTQEQYQMVQSFFAEAAARDLAISEWTGETPEQIQDRYQIPHDDILDDMADWHSAVEMGFSFS